MKGLILAGGLGKRLRPLTHTGPKQLIPVANKPVLFYCIEDLVNAGIKDIAIVVSGHDPLRAEAIKQAVGDGKRWNVNINYISQDQPRGLAHAVAIAKDFISDDNFVMYLGDNMLKGGINKFVEEFKNSGADASILLTKHKNPEKFGVAVLNDKNDIIELEEKPASPKSNLVIVGVYLFNSKIFDAISKIVPSARGELEITHAIQKLIENKDRVISHIIDGWWDDTGNAEDILHANHLILTELEHEIKGVIEDGARIIGDIRLGEGSTIRSGAVVRGPAVIGKNVIIGPNTYVGPYTSIGDNCNIEGCEVESSIIIEGVIIKVNKRIVDSLIGKDSKLLSSSNRLPSGHKLIIGENSEIEM